MQVDTASTLALNYLLNDLLTGQLTHLLAYYLRFTYLLLIIYYVLTFYLLFNIHHLLFTYLLPNTDHLFLITSYCLLNLTFTSYSYFLLPAAHVGGRRQLHPRRPSAEPRDVDRLRAGKK